MKIRIGFGLGTGALEGGAPVFASLVDDLERLRFDSLWLSERVTGGAPDPIVACAVAAGRTEKLKFGFSVLVLPGRNPVLLAKQLATLDFMSNGRLLPAVGLGVVDPKEQEAFGVERGERARIFDDSLARLRELLGPGGIEPQPVQQPMDIWLGGRSPAELRRVGRVGDGWLPSFCSPEEAAEGRVVVEKAAADAGRSMDPEHWGALIVYSTGGELSPRLKAVLEMRRPGRDPEEVVPSSLDGLRRQISRFVDVGFSKFVVVPGSPSAMDLDALAGAVLDLQTR